MDKLLLFPGKTDRGVFTYLVDAEKSYLEKTACEYHPTIAAYINAAKPIRGKTQILLTALGAGEWWGFNVNGDYFPETALAHEGADYGYKTFEHFAKIYKHHVNKDPTASFGDVALSVYNPTYHRVELIVMLDNARAPDIAQRIEHGDYPDWSMGCLKATAPVLMADYTVKPISEIRSGDKVINAKGTVSVVAYPHSHKHAGTWHYVQALGFGAEGLEPTTEEHPWLVISADQVACRGNLNNAGRRINLCLPNRDQKKGCDGCPNGNPVYTPTWKRADELNVGDYVGMPIPQEVVTGPGQELSYLLGVYVAEGHITSDGYVELTVGSADGHIYDRLCSLFPDKNIQWRIRDNCENAAKINIYDKALGSWCQGMAGRGALSKLLDPEVMRWTHAEQLSLLGGWCDGDGGVYRDSVYYSTGNRQLANQLQLLLARQGCVSSVNVNKHKPSALVKKSTVEYQVWVGRDTALFLKDASYKTRDLAGPRRMVKNQRFIANGYLWSPIVAIDTEPCEEDVYNIAIESGDYDADSYVVRGVALHNCKVPYDVCSICGNKAPTRKYYCEHLKYYLGRIHPETGRAAFAFNHHPKFFDISQVLIGADRIAKTHMKVASAAAVRVPSSAWLAEKMAVEDKEATIEKEIPAETPPASQESLDDLARGIMEVKAREPALPRTVLNSLGRQPFPEAMSTLAMLGILPKPQEFQRIVLVNLGAEHHADELDRKCECFDPMSVEEPSQKHLDGLGLSHQAFSPYIAKMLTPFLADRSYSAPLLGRRLMITIKQADEQPLPRLIKVSADDKERKPVGIIPMLALAAGLYAAYAKKAPPEAVRGLDKIITSNPGLAAALGLGLYATFNSLVKPGAKGNYTDKHYVNPDANDIFARIEQAKQKPYVKVGSVGSAAKRLLLGIPLAYMASGVLQKHKELNPYDEEGRVKSFVRRNPDVVSGALIADAMLSARGKGTHGLANKARSYFAKAAEAAEDHVKVASVQEFLSSSLIWPLAMGKTNLPGRVVSGMFDQAAMDIGQKLLERKHSKGSQGKK